MPSTSSNPPTGPEARWRARAAERATHVMREKANDRSDRFITTAFELLSEVGEDFSVREVVDRSQMSLRSFYLAFRDKDDLFLAIYEESLNQGYILQRRAVDAAENNPIARLRAFLQAEWDQAERSPQQTRRALTVYHQRLLESRPAELAAALEPQHAFGTELVRDCRAAGVPMPDPDDNVVAALLMHLMNSCLQAHVLGCSLGGQTVKAEQVWSLVSAALNTAPTRAKAKAFSGKGPH